MPDPIFKVNVAEWVDSVKADPIAYQQRQTVEITLNAIAMAVPLKGKMFLRAVSSWALPMTVQGRRLTSI